MHSRTRAIYRSVFCGLALTLVANSVAVAARPLPEEIRQIFRKPIYRDAIWGMRVVDLDTGKLIYDFNTQHSFLIGSVRKLFSVGVALDALGPAYRFRTPVYRKGTVDGAGVLSGDLILVASGDLSMGGRTNPDGTFAISDLDHNEANTLGNAVLTGPDPLAGYNALAAQVAAAGIKQITGEVIIDDRLFRPFNFRDEFDIRPIFVNDDVVDVIINPTSAGQPASVDWRPKSAALSVESSLVTTAAGTDFEIDLIPELPNCIGLEPCVGTVAGTLPIDLVPPMTGQFPLIRTFRIVQPSNYARTVFIEALNRAGVSVAARAVAPNPHQALPARASYPAGTRVAELISSPYKEYAKLILKVSYNIGADTSLMLFGVTQGIRSFAGARLAELRTLATKFGIPVRQVHFVDGSGGGNTRATSQAVIKLLTELSRRRIFPAFRNALPILGVDGSLASITDFEADRALAGAKGQVRAKTGTFVEGAAQGFIVNARAMAGYIDAKSGRRLAYFLVVNHVAVSSISDVPAIFQDLGTISAILWKVQ